MLHVLVFFGFVAEICWHRLPILPIAKPLKEREKEGMETGIDLKAVHEEVVREIELHGMGPGSLLNILDGVQRAFRYVPMEALYEISRLGPWDLADICAVVSSFSEFSTDPVGETLILVCDGTACHAAGSVDVIQALEDALGITCGQTTPDGKYTLKSVFCVGACSLAPLVMIDDHGFGKVRLTDIPGLLEGDNHDDC